MAIKKSQLYRTLWESCNALRGSMDASQYKDYVLMMLFVRYLSDKAKLNQIRLKVPEGCFYEDFSSLKSNSHIGELINTKLEAIKEANPSYIGDLVLPNFNDPTKFGEGKTMVDTLSKLIAEFERNELDFSQNRAADDDLLGDAYEYLMKNFAAESGKSKGQFYTPAEVSRVIAKVLHLEDLERASNSIYDPTCGSGSLLLRALNETPRGNVSLRGQEKDSTTASLAKLNMLLHGIVRAKIEVGDTLNNPKFTSGDMLETFDVCIANPPFSQKNWLSLDSESGGENDKYHRWNENMLPPTKCGDYAFLKHLIASMNAETGRGACILPHGVLFRGNAEYAIRKDIIEKHLIKGIIGLPANIFFGTGIPASILIIDKREKDTRKGIFFIDAKDGFMKDGAKNRLREQDIKRIVDTWDAQRNIPHYARFVSYEEIKANDYNLNIPRYIVPEDKEIHQDIKAHLRGGLPKSDIDAMSHYWDVCTGLKDKLFKQEGDYYRQNTAIDEIPTIIEANEGIKAQKDAFEKLLNKWQEYAKEQMYTVGKGSAPKQLIAQWSEKLLEEMKSREGLTDAYNIYDILMNYWQETLQDDCYMISNDGWTYPRVVAVKKTEKFNKKKNETTIKETACYYDGIVCDLLPVDIILDEFFKGELEKIEDKRNDLESVISAISSLVEDNAEDFTFGDDSADNEDSEDSEKATEIKVVEKTLNAALAFAKKNNGDQDQIALWEEWKKLNKDKKDKTKELKDLQISLTKLVVAKYAELTEKEVRTLVIERKWLPTIKARSMEDFSRITRGIVTQILAVVNRYETPYTQLTASVDELENKVLGHLANMGFEL